MSQNFQRIYPAWVEKPITSLYPSGDRGKQVKNATRVICRALEFVCTAAESNALYDISGRYKCDRSQGFTIHKQVK